jgi:hypothetical protein
LKGLTTQAMLNERRAKKDLVDALAALVRERRSCVRLLSQPYERSTYEATMARLVELQTPIEALERALVS